MRTTPSPARRKHTRPEHGFTLVELLMTMLVSSLIMIGVYAAFEMQNRTHSAQEQNVDMQQNIRAAMTMLSSDIRMAGFDPTGEMFNKESEPVITRAEQGRITFVTVAEDEEDNNKLKKKYVSYRISSLYDQNGDGVVEISPKRFYEDVGEDDAGVMAYSPSLIRCEQWERECDFGRDELNNNWQAVARGVEAVEFVYTVFDPKKDRTTYELWRENDKDAKEKSKYIRAVTISLLMRADTPDRRISPLDPAKASELRPASRQLYRRGGLLASTWSTVIKRKIAEDRDGSEGERQHRRHRLYTTVEMRNRYSWGSDSSVGGSSLQSATYSRGSGSSQSVTP